MRWGGKWEDEETIKDKVMREDEKSYESDDLIASIVSMEQPLWEDYKAFDFNSVVNFLCASFVFAHKIHT